jgi:hypothetical protein
MSSQLPILLPDGTPFPVWEDETDYQKAYYVDQQHPGAADDNPGTEEAPFLTIQAAAEVVGPAAKVLIKSGIYREWVQPRRGGTGADGMICYEAAPGAEAIISGSDVVSAPWVNSDLWVSVWKTDLTDAFFEDGHPFAMMNTSDEEFEIMRWARGSKGTIPHCLPRAMVFQNGRRLTQLGTLNDVSRVTGTFWIDTENKALYVRPFDRTDPNTCEMEATTRQFLLNPLVKGLGYIRIAGLTFEHAGNGFIRSGHGAVATWGGHHWIIEHNTVRHINGAAIEMGAFTEEGPDSGDAKELEKTIGDHMVLHNHVYDCGRGGIQGTVVARSLVADNHIHDIGWQEVQSYQEAAGVKILLTLDAVVQCNHIHDCHGAPAIWIDCGNRNSRVCRNHVHDIAAANGAIFFEASNVLNLIDHNIVDHVEQGSGIYARDCDKLLIAHNLIQRCSHSGVRLRKTPTRDRVGVCKDNRLINNVIARCGVAFEFEVMENISDNNIFTDMGHDFSLVDWQASGLDAHSAAVELDLAIDAEHRSLTWSSSTQVPRVPRDELLTLDYFGRAYSSDTLAVGPFAEGWSTVRRQLQLAQNS